MKKKILLYFCASIVVLALMLFATTHFRHRFARKEKTHIAKTLSVLPARDQAILRHFFYHIITHEKFGYTLFGSKPLTICAIAQSNAPSLATLPRSQTSSSYLTEQDWQTWDKYKHLFPSRKYSLRKVISPKRRQETIILLINKKNFLKTTEKHLQLFQKIHSPKFTAQDLLSIFLTHPAPFKKGLKNRVMLQGILFGFGKANSSLFNRKRVIEKALLSDAPSPVKPSAHFQSLQEELHSLTDRLRPFFPKDKTPILLPHFLANTSSKETEALKQKYSEQRKIINQVLESEDFLETALRRFCS